MNETNTIITYEGSQISLFSENSNDYVNLTDMANACKNRKAILAWIRSKQTIDFLVVWEKKHNEKYDNSQLGIIVQMLKDRNLSIKNWVELTNAKGIFTRVGEFAGTYAHKDIAIKFAGYLNPEFELYLVEEIQRLKELERKKNSFELLTHQQVLYLIQLKEVFKYVAHQEAIEDAHKDVFASKSIASNPFADFNKWRNEILDISPQKIDARIQEFCVNHNIAVTKKLLAKTKREKLLMIDSPETVRNAVWDFLKIKGDINALSLANLVSDILRTEQGQVMRENKTDLFHEKQELGVFSNFVEDVSRMKEVKTAREYLALKTSKKPIELSDHNKKLKQALNYNPKDK
jgi:hypothetical protein